MKHSRHITSSFLGIYAGLLAIEHGIFEILQGNRAPGGLQINAIGAPCQPEAAWHACYPALTLIPSFLVSGILAIVAGLGVMTWAAAFVQRQRGGLMLILLSIFMLLIGGGFVPTFVGVVAGVMGNTIHKPLNRQLAGSAKGLHLLAKLWLWTLILMGVWFPGSWLLGYFFNQAMLAMSGFLFLFFSISLPVLAAFSGIAHEKEML